MKPGTKRPRTSSSSAYRPTTQTTCATYTIGTRAYGSDPNAVAFDVYLPSDLTTPISRYYGNGKTVVVREQEVYTETFALPDEFYVRTRGRDPGFVGDYFLYVKRHTCATKDEACALQPDMPQSATLTKANSLFGTQDEAWFEFDVVGQSDSGAHQTIRLEAAGLPDASNFEARPEDFFDTDGSGPPPEQVLGTNRVLVGPMGPGSTGYLLIRQGAPTANDVTVSASMQTSLRILEIEALVCDDETNPEFGSDDIFTQVTIDGMTKRFPSGAKWSSTATTLKMRRLGRRTLDRQWSPLSTRSGCRSSRRTTRTRTTPAASTSCLRCRLAGPCSTGKSSRVHDVAFRGRSVLPELPAPYAKERAGQALTGALGSRGR